MMCQRKLDGVHRSPTPEEDETLCVYQLSSSKHQSALTLNPPQAAWRSREQRERAVKTYSYALFHGYAGSGQCDSRLPTELAGWCTKQPTVQAQE